MKGINLRFAAAVVAVPGLLVIVSVVVATTAGDAMLSTNADLLYLKTLYDDAVGPYTTAEWVGTPSPYFVPDMLGYFLFRALLTDHGHAMVAYGVCQSWLTLGAAWFFFRRAEPRLVKYVPWVWGLVYLAGAVAYSFAYTRALVFPTYHGALPAFCFVVGGLFAHQLNEEGSLRQRWPLLVIGGLAVALCVDAVAIFGLAGGLFTGWLILRWMLRSNEGSFWGPAIRILISAALLALSVRFAVTWIHGFSSPSGINLTRWPEKIASGSFHLQVWETLTSLVVDSTWAVALVVLGALFALATSTIALRHARAGRARALFARLFVVLSGAMSLLGPLVLTLLEDAGGLRYLTPLLIVTPFGLVFAFGWLEQRLATSRMLLIGLGLMLYSMGGALANDRIEKVRRGEIDFSTVYPEPVECIDRAAVEHGLTHGISTYWPAKYVRALSRRGVQVNEFRDDLTRRRWISNQAWYLSPEGQPLEYQFALVKSGEGTAFQKTLLERFGEPTRVVECPRYDVWLYRAPDRHDFSRFDWPATN